MSKKTPSQGSPNPEREYTDIDLEAHASHSSTSPLQPPNISNNNNLESERPSRNRTPRTISSKEEEDFKWGDEEEELESISVNDIKNIKRRFKSVPEYMLVFFEVLFIAFLTLTPALVVYFAVDFTKYPLFKAVGPEKINFSVEFIRWSIFIATFFISFTLLDFLTKALPVLVHATLSLFRIKIADSLEVKLGYIVRVQKYICLGLLFIAMAIFSEYIVLDPVKPRYRLRKTFTWHFYFKKVLLALAVGSIIFVIEKLLVQMISISFHKQAFSKRIKEWNMNFKVIETLHRCTGKQSFLDIITGGRKSPISNLLISQEGAAAISSSHAASAYAHQIFDKLCPSSRDTLTIEDFRPYFRPEEVSEAFAVFDTDISGEVTKLEMRDTLLELFEERKMIEKSMASHVKIVDKVDMILMCVAFVITALIVLPFFDIDAVSMFTSFLTTAFLFGFIFQDTVKIVFTVILFIFAVHAYDVGDKLILTGKTYTVRKIELFSTQFVESDGTLTYMPNAEVSKQTIFNIRRSGFQSETISLHLDASTPTDLIFKLKDAIQEHINEYPKDFTGSLSMGNLIALDQERLTVEFTVQHKDNFQDGTSKLIKHNRLMIFIKDKISELGISYHPPEVKIKM